MGELCWKRRYGMVSRARQNIYVTSLTRKGRVTRSSGELHRSIEARTLNGGSSRLPWSREGPVTRWDADNIHISSQSQATQLEAINAAWAIFRATRTAPGRWRLATLSFRRAIVSDLRFLWPVAPCQFRSGSHPGFSRKLCCISKAPRFSLHTRRPFGLLKEFAARENVQSGDTTFG